MIADYGITVIIIVLAIGITDIGKYRNFSKVNQQEFGFGEAPRSRLGESLSQRFPEGKGKALVDLAQSGRMGQGVGQFPN